MGAFRQKGLLDLTNRGSTRQPHFGMSMFNLSNECFIITDQARAGNVDYYGNGLDDKLDRTRYSCKPPQWCKNINLGMMRG